MKHTLYPPEQPPLDDEELLVRLNRGYPEEERALIASALELAIQASQHELPGRPRGIDVALIVHQLNVDATTVQVALLSDPHIRDSIDPSVIHHRFGAKTAELVQKVNWLNTFDEYRKSETKEPNQAELLRSMLLAVVNDVRAVMVKLAYRLQRLRLMRTSPDEQLRRDIAVETLDLFTPLANRLGVGQLKWEMEDLSFRYLDPEEYRRLAKSLASNRVGREAFVQHFIAELKHRLGAAGIDARVFGRPKHIFSIHKKIERKDIPLEELYDLHAVRVIVKDVPACYTVLGVVHSIWLHIPKELDDYIANPKPNGYQSLHTVVIGPEGKPVEIQIRTEEMHSFAEFGVAAHWRYKEGSRQDQALDQNVNALRRILEARDDEQGILDSFRSELFEDQIFVLTPKGQVIRLRKGATPVDFAYGIHTEVGHRCRGAKVNGKMVALTHSLKSGERVEILTAKHGGPSLGWLDPHLGYVKTTHARNKIRAWFRQQDHERHIRAGKMLLDDARHKLSLKEIDTESLAKHFHLPRSEDLFLAIGRLDITSNQLDNALKPTEKAVRPQSTPRKTTRGVDRRINDNEIMIQGVRNLVTHIARCCQPQPGDPIVGFVTVARGIAIHRQDCKNVLGIPASRQNRLLDVTWGAEGHGAIVDLSIQAIDRKGIIKEITHLLAADGLEILKIQNRPVAENQKILIQVRVAGKSSAMINRTLGELAELPDVLEIRKEEPSPHSAMQKRTPKTPTETGD
ncbi:MAG: diphosphokinase [Pseudomonadota bacterium]|jgi:GTP pyrophosphokinase